ncbi:MAG: SPOR domain-containing protein [Xanthomonadales bacterium]|nr:SPOR domain-containing protein [Xanthomonadales bacterium]
MPLAPNSRMPLILALLSLAAGYAHAQQAGVECEPDEIESGEYCVKLAVPEGMEGIGRKATPFRKEGMMPGRVRPGQKLPAGEKPQVVVTKTIPAPVTAQGGFGIQVGVWSRRDAARAVCLDVAALLASVILSPIARQDQTLWACLAGPYASRESALADLDAVQANPDFASAWVKPLTGMRIEGLDND